MCPKHISIIYSSLSHRNETIGDTLGINFATYWDVTWISDENSWNIMIRCGCVWKWSAPAHFTASLLWNVDKPVDFEVARQYLRDDHPKGFRPKNMQPPTRWNRLASGSAAHITMKKCSAEFRCQSRKTVGQVATAYHCYVAVAKLICNDIFVVGNWCSGGFWQLLCWRIQQHKMLGQGKSAVCQKAPQGEHYKVYSTWWLWLLFFSGLASGKIIGNP